MGIQRTIDEKPTASDDWVGPTLETATHLPSESLNGWEPVLGEDEVVFPTPVVYYDEGTFADLQALDAAWRGTFTVKGEASPNEARNGDYIVDSEGPRQIHSIPEPKSLTVTSVVDSSNLYFTRITSTLEYGSNVYNDLEIVLTFNDSAQSSRTLTLSGAPNALPTTVTDSAGTITSSAQTGTYYGENNTEINSVSTSLGDTVAVLQGTLEDLYIVHSIGDIYGDIDISVEVTDSLAQTDTDNVSLTDVAMADCQIVQDGSGGTNAIFDPVVTYRTTTHVPTWAGGISATSLAPAVPAASVTTGNIVLTFVTWAVDNIRFADNNISAIGLASFYAMTSLDQMFRDTSLNPSLIAFDLQHITTIADFYRDNDTGNPYTEYWNTSNLVDASNAFNGSVFDGSGLANWNISSLNDAADMLTGTTISTAHYDALLIAWGAQATLNAVQNDVSFGAGGATYTSGGAAAAGRAALVTKGWTITDGGTA